MDPPTCNLLPLSPLVLYLTTLTSPFSLLPSSLSSSSSTSSSSFLESNLHPLPTSLLPATPPRLAYLISGSAGDGQMLKRTLLALYHPNNRYVVHLEAESRLEERLDLENFVKNHTVFVKFSNVAMIKKANLVTYRGPTMVSNTLHAAAVLLRAGGEWDWVVYGKESWYFNDYAAKKRADGLQALYRIFGNPGGLPVSFNGSAWMALSRPFIDFCIWGWDNLPRTVLMYYANFISSPEGYFHTVVCNAEEFRNTTVNSDLHFVSWDNPPKQHPQYLTVKHMAKMVASNAPFARKFHMMIRCSTRSILNCCFVVKTWWSPVGGAWEAGKMGPILAL
ncbi:hypothetical protein C3L33_01576, partial [Rhododendron williamsianum]